MAVEVGKRSRKQDRMSEGAVVHYGSLRDDWIKGADVVARLVSNSATNGTTLAGFPRQWIPIFVNFSTNWHSTIAPRSFISMASDLTEEELVDICARARQEGVLRTLVEAFASLDPLVADVLHKLDRRSVPADVESIRYLPLTGWQSYGRPEIQLLSKQIVDSAKAKAQVAVLLPCARKRPYELSRTHRRIWRGLEEGGVDSGAVDKIVVSSIGIVPEEFWNHPVVSAYDSGVPDIYRILRLMRLFFSKARYATVIDCLEFRPYSDCLGIVAREGLIGAVRIERSVRAKSLPQP
jgi:predicted RNA-binding protein